MALNIIFGGALGNITASQVLAIPDGQLKTDVRFPFLKSIPHSPQLSRSLSANPHATQQPKPSRYAFTFPQNIIDSLMVMYPLFLLLVLTDLRRHE